MSAADPVELEIQRASFDAATRALVPDGDYVAVPRDQWNALSVAMGASLDCIVDPAAYLEQPGGAGTTVSYTTPHTAGGMPIVGGACDSRLDGYRQSPDDTALTIAERERTLYVQALTYTMIGRAGVVRHLGETPPTTGGIFLPILGAAALVAVAAVWLISRAVVDNNVRIEELRVKAGQHHADVAVAQAAADYRERLCVHRETGTMPEPSETERASRASIERAAQAFRESPRGIVDQVLDRALGRADDAGRRAATGALGEFMPWAIGAAVLWFLFK